MTKKGMFKRNENNNTLVRKTGSGKIVRKKSGKRSSTSSERKLLGKKSKKGKTAKTTTLKMKKAEARRVEAKSASGKRSQIVLPESLVVQSIPWETVVDDMYGELHKTHEKYIDETERSEQESGQMKERKKLSMMKLVMREKLRHAVSENKFEIKFWLDVMKLMEKFESTNEQVEMDMKPWQLFLAVTSEKMKNEPLVVHGKLETSAGTLRRVAKGEFDRMKL